MSPNRLSVTITSYCCGRLHEVDAGGVDVVVGRGDVGVLGGDLVERALPQVAGEGQHVGLVHQREVLARAGCWASSKA